MEISPQSDRSVAEEKEEAFVGSTPRRKKRSLAARRAALRPWVIGIGLTVLVAVAAVVAYRLGAGIASWNKNPSASVTPTVHPAPVPTVSSEPAMSGGYEIGPDGVLVRPAEFAAHSPMINDPARCEGVRVIGVDEHVWRHTPYGDRCVTVILDLTLVHDRSGPSRLLDMVPGRSKQVFKTWLASQPNTWRERIEIAAMDEFAGF